MKKYFVLLLPLAGIFALLSAPDDAVLAGANALDFCIKTIIPSLLPFLVFSSLAVYSGFSDICARIFGKIMQLVFGVSAECSTAIILGFISGFPIGAKTAAELCKSGKCTKAQAETLLTFCNGASPAFVIGTVGGILWNDVKIGVLLFISQSAALILTGIIFGKSKTNGFSYETIKNESASNVSFLSSVVSAVTSSALTALYISAFIVFFAVISEMLMHYGIIPYIAKMLNLIFGKAGLYQNDFEALLCGFVEFSTGVKNTAAGGSGIKQAVITSLILSWSGLSVHCQVAAAVIPQGLSLKKYLGGKVLSTLFSAIITYALYILFYR
jgi:sporulation integral membrane protein YlbJ